MSDLIWKLRCWLIARLAGNAQVFINTNVHGGVVYLKEGPLLMVGNTFINNTFHGETDEVTQQLVASAQTQGFQNKKGRD